MIENNRRISAAPISGTRYVASENDFAAVPVFPGSSASTCGDGKVWLTLIN
ncbi:hypothetical protein [Saccharopolyspora flava]|uniref:hypothetical protein n=1 Tax=Saccharopolyspora flava TaxID=95161 RepID=UPI0015877EE7|nr:hypothetical protein [Saccharopolyspora flava]